MFAKAREVPLLLSDGEGCRQHARPHQVRLPHKILEPEVQKSKVSSIFSRALDAGACGIVAPMINNREDAQRLVDQCRCLMYLLVFFVPFGTFCTFWYLCRLDTPAGLMVFSRYAPEGKRSWGPTRALAGDITPEQSNAYVKVGGWWWWGVD